MKNQCFGVIKTPCYYSGFELESYHPFLPVPIQIPYEAVPELIDKLKNACEAIEGHEALVNSGKYQGITGCGIGIKVI